VHIIKSIYKIPDSPTTKEEFLRLANAKLREYKNLWKKPKETEKETGGKWKKVLYK